MKALSWINFILGLWLILAGFVLSTASRAVMTEEIVLGIVIAVLSAISMTTVTSWLSWLVALAGVWTLIAPAIISYAGMTTSRANDVIVGIIVIILAAARALSPSPVMTKT